LITSDHSRNVPAIHKGRAKGRRHMTVATIMRQSSPLMIAFVRAFDILG
jgi:hypothetical protein